MTELRPLFESSDDELERALLQSVRMDLPRPAGLRQTALALGLATSTANALAATLPAVSSLGTAAGAPATAALGPVSASGGAATTGTAAATAASAGGTLGVASLGVLGKSLLGGALVSFMALTTLDQTRGAASKPAVPVSPAVLVARRAEEARTPPVRMAASSVPTDAQPSLRATTSLPGGRHAPSAVPAPAAAVACPAPSAAPAKAAFAVERELQPASPGAATNVSLAAEIRVLDQARTALAAGDTQRAAQLLDAYAASRPSATLSQEAALLRVRLLLSQGQRSAAAQLARRIIAQHPESAHVDSLRRLATEP